MENVSTIIIDQTEALIPTWQVQNAMAVKFQSCERLGVDAHIPDSHVQTPFCIHGPTILFERFFKNKSPRRFFACSASRDRKGCPFFQWEDEKITTGKDIIQNEIKQKLQQERENVEKISQKREEWLSAQKTLHFCFDCNKMFVETVAEHKDHEVKKLSKTDLNEPSKFMHPAENKKTNAQYLFSGSSCSFIVDLLTKLGYEKIICLGVPRVHEKIQKMKGSKSGTAESIFLDIDKRYAQFFPPPEFLHYNMFNNYFFGGEVAEKTFRNFIAEVKPGKIALVMDPPFGGMMSILAASLKKLLATVDKDPGLEIKDIAVMMIFPYFLEGHVTEAFPSLKLMDYKISYENHPNFKERSSESKRGSPIRIYTNISGEEFVLPKSEGYRFCDACKRYVSEENKHCNECNQCTSKDGRTYVHCDLCGKCVKPGRIHCPKCQRCELDKHNCELKSMDSFACHVCGEVGHKRRDCPTKVAKTLKRKSPNVQENGKKVKLSKKRTRKGKSKKGR